LSNIIGHGALINNNDRTLSYIVVVWCKATKPNIMLRIFMDDHTALSQLEGLAYMLGIQIRYEKIVEDEVSSTGGLCRVKGEWVIIINSRATINEKIQTLAKSLKNFDLNNIYVRPALRELLEK
jgi:hypothetical protein